MQGAGLHEAQPDDLPAVVIEKGQASATGRHLGRKRVVTDPVAANQRHHCTNVHDILGLDAKQVEPLAIAGLADEGNAGEAQEADRIRCATETLQEGSLDEVEVDGARILGGMGVSVRQMRRLPLHGLGSGRVVTDASGFWVVDMAVGMAVVVPVVVIVAAMHGQKLTGLSMMDLCFPSVPWATMEPRASTTTRTPRRAVMSDVS